MINLISFLIVISISVIFHEGGHYIAAKFRHVFVHEFSFGMGPSIFSKKFGETLWSFRALPIGGYVKLEGEDNENQTKIIDSTKSLNNKDPWERLLIIVSGAFVNISLAIILTAFYLSANGIYNLETPVIGKIVTDTPAAISGILEGDKILSINGESVNEWKDISRIINNNKLTKNVFEVELNRNLHNIKVYPEIKLNNNRRILGVQPSKIDLNIFESFYKSFSYTFNMGYLILKDIIELVMGRVKGEVVGPVGIAIIAGDAIKQGFWSFITFLAVINLHLGLLNLLPFPALDGGRAIFIVIELITGKKLSQKNEGMIHYIGFIFLIFLMIFITFKDIMKLF
ncbi:MAG: RIP metalloprotease RseP [Synergistaceae bacterium]